MKNKLASLLVVPLAQALNGIPPIGTVTKFNALFLGLHMCYARIRGAQSCARVGSISLFLSICGGTVLKKCLKYYYSGRTLGPALYSIWAALWTIFSLDLIEFVAILTCHHNRLLYCRKDYSHSKSMHQAYMKKADESRERLIRQDAELVGLETRIEEVKEQEQQEYDRIQELRETIRQVEFETGELTKKKIELERELEEMVSCDVITADERVDDVTLV